MFDETMKLFENKNDIQELTTTKTTTTNSKEITENVNISINKQTTSKPPLYIGIDLESNRNIIN